MAVAISWWNIETEKLLLNMWYGLLHMEIYLNDCQKYERVFFLLSAFPLEIIFIILNFLGANFNFPWFTYTLIFTLRSSLNFLKNFFANL